MKTDTASSAWLTQQPYAHRGLHGAGRPENSLGAFAAAIAAGLGIECDIRKAGNGRAMVFHDAELDRLTDQTGLVCDHSVGELTSIRLTGSDEHIPTLRDLLELVAGQVPILLELKSDNDRAIGPLCRAVRRDCEGYTGPFAVMSFDPRIVRWFAARKLPYPRGLVVTEQGSRTFVAGVKRRLMIRMAQPDFLACDIRDLPSALAARQVGKGRPLLSWTVKSADQLATARKAGATPIVEAAGVAALRSQT